LNTGYITRSIESVVLKAAREFPVVVLTGPRQSGKTTLLRHLFGQRYRYVSLEPPDIRAAAMTDPRGFLQLSEPPVILDEVQHAPDLLPYIKERVDASRTEPGQYLLTGSQNLLLAQNVTESLAGRAAVLRLMPLSRREAAAQPERNLPWQDAEERSTAEMTAAESGPDANPLWPELLRGYFPEVVAGPERDVGLWHASYVQTYLERDVRNLRQVGDLTQFQLFLRALAARSAQLLNLSDLARDLGVVTNTAKAWLSVLEATYQVIVLRPYHANIGKRLVKRPKVYFTDVGTLCYLVGLRDAEHAASGPMGGAIFETAVVAEVFKALTHRGLPPQIYFWRTAAGAEVDLLIDEGSQLIPVEAKLSATPRPAMASGIQALRKDFEDHVAPGYVVHPGEVCLPLGQGTVALPFALL
jgi:predicted AAA+ superfamily ATPase